MLGWELPPNNSGGLGVACLNLSRALAKEGADIHFVVPYESKEDAKQIDFMEVVSALHIDPIFRYGLGAYDTKTIEEKIIPSIDPKKLISIRDIQREYCKFIDEYLEDYTPDVVHAHGPDVRIVITGDHDRDRLPQDVHVLHGPADISVFDHDRIADPRQLAV